MLRYAGVIEVEEDSVIDPQVAAAQTGLKLLNLSQSLLVAGKEAVAGLPIALYQGRLDKNLAGSYRVNPPVLDTPVGNDGQPKEGDLLMGQHRALAGRPVRVRIRVLEQGPSQFLNPFGLNLRVHARPQAGCLYQLSRYQPDRVLLKEGRAGENCEAGTARPSILVAVLLILHTDMRQQTREQRLVHLGLTGSRVNIAPALNRNTGRAANLPQLGKEILPLSDSQEVQVLPVAHLAELARRQLCLLLIDVLPQQQIGGEV